MKKVEEVLNGDEVASGLIATKKIKLTRNIVLAVFVIAGIVAVFMNDIDNAILASLGVMSALVFYKIQLRKQNI